jgi:hypothetical protein
VLAVPGLSFAEITEAGVQRVSVGANSRGSWSRQWLSGSGIRDAGDFSALATDLPLAEWFSD